MTQASLKYVSDVFSSLALEYGYQRYEGSGETYWVGSYAEQPFYGEDNDQLSLFLLDGFTISDSWLALEEQKEILKSAFADVRTVLTNGNGMSIEIENVSTIPTGTAEIKRIEIQLSIKEWRI